MEKSVIMIACFVFVVMSLLETSRDLIIGLFRCDLAFIWLVACLGVCVVAGLGARS